MTLLRDFIDQTLQWKRARFFSSMYELHAGDQILATINYSDNKRTSAEAEGQQWTFQREGRKKLLVYSGEFQASSESAQPLASIQPGWNWKGELTFEDGRTYTWNRRGNWRPTWFWSDAGDETLLALKKGRLLEIAPTASNASDLALLALFGMYLILSMEGDEATFAAASIPTSG